MQKGEFAEAAHVPVHVHAEVAESACRRRLWQTLAVFGVVGWLCYHTHYLKPGDWTWHLPSGAVASSSSDTCSDYLNDHVRSPFNLILTADPGDFSGVSEAHHILSNLKHRRLKPRGETVCADLYKGILLGTPTLVVTTGIGPTAAGLCTQEIVTACGPLIKELIYFGTSGWSPQLGGVLNPPNCQGANSNRQITRVGDICISPITVNSICKKSTWDLQAEGWPNQCFNPTESYGPNATFLFGDCVFATDNLQANLALSDAITAAARSAKGRNNFPTRNQAVVDQEEVFWRLMGQGTQMLYPNVTDAELPAVWEHSQCAEVDGQFFWTGVPWEVKAREYAAQAINTALKTLGSSAHTARGQVRTAQAAAKHRTSAAAGTRKGRVARKLADTAPAQISQLRASSQPPTTEPYSSLHGPQEVGAHEVIAVSAMEGIGVGEAMRRYHALSGTRHIIPYTHVRTMSNWLHQPVTQVSPGVWEVLQDLPDDYVNGYAYAIATGSAAILTLYQQRCLNASAASGTAGSIDCTFHIEYHR